MTTEINQLNAKLEAAGMQTVDLNQYPGGNLPNKLEVQGKLDNTLGHILIDIHPFKTSFHLTLGAYFGKDEIILDQSKLKSLTFMDVSATKIDALMAEGNLCVQLTDEGLQLNGLQASEAVKIYSLDGKLLYAATASPDGSAHIGISRNQPGTVYVIKAGNASFKIRTR